MTKMKAKVPGQRVQVTPLREASMGFRQSFLRAVACLSVILFLVSSTASVFAASSSYSGGRSSFSSPAKSSYTGSPQNSAKSPSQSPPSNTTSPSKGSKVTSPASPTQADKPSGGRSSFTSEKKSFSTARETTPDSLTKDYQTRQKDYSSGGKSYVTNRTSYTGKLDRQDEKDTVQSIPKDSSVKYSSQPSVGQVLPISYDPSPKRNYFATVGPGTSPVNITGPSTPVNPNQSKISGGTAFLILLFIVAVAVAIIYFAIKRIIRRFKK